MAKNFALMERVLDRITADREHWDQRFYRGAEVPGCGTFMCFAGWTCDLASGQWVCPSNEADHSYLYAESRYDEVPGSIIHAAERARRLLGLDHGESSQLFAGMNQLDDIERIITEWKAEVNVGA